MNRLLKIVAFAVVSLIASSTWAASTTQPDPLDSLARKTRDLKEAQEKQQADQKTPGATGVDTVPLKDKPVEGGAAPEAKKDGADDAHDESELVKALLRKAGVQDEPIMDRVIKGMTKSREFLREKFDPGAETQLVQGQIIDDLTAAIKAAAAAQSKGQGSGKPKPGEGSGKPQDAKPGDGKPGPGKSPGGTQAATESQLRPGSAQNGETNKDIKESRTEWGNLPARDRSEVVTGHNEEGLPLWEEMINKYYQSLNVQSSKQ
jgi:hypothetical protein